MDNAVLIALLGSAVTFAGVIVSLIVSINTSKGAARKDMVVTLQTDNDTLRAENKELRLEIKRLDTEKEREIAELREWIDELREQIRKLGDVPVTPKRRASNG